MSTLIYNLYILKILCYEKNPEYHKWLNNWCVPIDETGTKIKYVYYIYNISNDLQ